MAESTFLKTQVTMPTIFSFFLFQADDLKRIMRFFLLVSVLFLISICLGIFFVEIHPAEAQLLLKQAARGFAPYGDLSGFSLFAGILYHNVSIAFLMLLFGIFFSIFPLLLILFNGFLIGVIGVLVSDHVGAVSTAFGLLPHAIFELPAILLAGTLGVILGLHLWDRIFRQKVVVSFGKEFSAAMRMFILWIVPMLIIAALIESFLTSSIMTGTF